MLPTSRTVQLDRVLLRIRRFVGQHERQSGLRGVGLSFNGLPYERGDHFGSFDAKLGNRRLYRERHGARNARG